MAAISGCCVDVHQLFVLTPLTFCTKDIFSADDVAAKLLFQESAYSLMPSGSE
jgi:hypothetical protein